MPQIHSPYSSQLELTVAALPTINIAKGCALGQEGPLTLTLIFNDENKQAHTLPCSSTCTHTSTHALYAVPTYSESTLGFFRKAPIQIHVVFKSHK
ncbi:hypothetical protein EXN66_Car017195 [Channa argus]|uniref:Uncharacterized protein n=1 Tax=Channa argus TaxID=215402 RepID=A0A6G1QGB0_CHAAH|nr:hypothetical protein EXN66_Car017195 [Channa argus]